MRTTLAGLAGLLIVTGCARVVIDDDELGPSSASPASAVAVGSGGSSAVGSGDGVGGSATTGSGTGGGPSATTGGGVEDASLVWSEASTREVTALGGVGDFAALAWPDHAPVPLLFSHRQGEDGKDREYSLEDVEDAWVGTPRLVNRYTDEMTWGHWPERGGVVASSLFGRGYDDVPSPGWRVALNKPSSADGQHSARVHFRELWHEGPKGGSPDAERPLVRALATVSSNQDRTHLYVLGDDDLAVQVGLQAPPVSGFACADRRIPVAALGLDDRFVVAHAAGASPCGLEPLAPDTAELIFLDAEDAVLSFSERVPLGAVVTELQVVRGGDALWIAARVEGDAGVELARMSLDGVVQARARLALADDRAYALATWDEELIVVDAGRDGDEASRLRARVVDPSGATVLTTAPLPASGREITTVAAVGSSDGDAVLVAFVDRLEENGTRLRYGVVRADVTGSR